MITYEDVVTATEPEKWETLDCPVCEGKSFTKLFEKQGEPFARCNGCGLVMINPRPVYSEVIKTYDHDYSEFYIKKAVKKIQRAKRWAKAVQKTGVKEGRWLDVGCSAGLIVKAVEELGYDAYGVDVEKHGIEFAQSELGLKNVSHGMLEEQKYPDKYFNVISAYDVIEHVPDLNSFVSELARILAPGGVIDIRTPDVGHWAVPRRLETWNAIQPSEHLYYLDKKTLPLLFSKYNLKLIKHIFNFKPTIKMYFSQSSKDNVYEKFVG